MNNATPRRRAGPFGRAFVVLAGEAFGGQIAERRSAAVAPSTGSGQAAVGVVVVGGQGVAGLVDKGDKTHFDTPSARELGRRYAEAMKSF